MVPRSLPNGFQLLFGADSKAARGTEYTWKATIFPALNLVALVPFRVTQSSFCIYAAF